MIKITDKLFKYTPSFNTDLRKKFRKIVQDRLAEERKLNERIEQERRAAEENEKANKVVVYNRKR